MSSRYWNGELGELMRESFSEEYKGLPQQEPIFNLNFIPLRTFSGFVRENRNIILIQKDSKSMLSFKKNLYASPQVLFKINGKNEEEIFEKFSSRKEEIFTLFKKIFLEKMCRDSTCGTIAGATIGHVTCFQIK